MKKVSLLFMLLTLGWMYAGAGGPSFYCTDLNEYVPDVKEVGSPGSYSLQGGSGNISRAAQTYNYSGQGRLNRVTVQGAIQAPFWHAQLRVRVYNVDANNRPTTLIATSFPEHFFIWEGSENFYFPFGGPNVSGNFAVSVELVNENSLGQKFELAYTGNGEGNGEDLASLSGDATGFNWSSAMTDHGLDGDFYIMPRVRHNIQADFSKSKTCLSTAESVSFTNFSPMSTDPMFNMAPNFYEWDFGDGSPLSNATNPTHSYSSAGTYIVSLTTYFDGYGGTSCSHTYTQEVSVGVNVTATNIIDASCYGYNDGSVVASGSGGKTPYTYSMDDVTYQASASFNSLSAGTYSLYIKDALGCKNSTSFSISEPGEIEITSVLSTNASCGNADGALQIVASGGTGTLQYSVDGGSTFQSSGTFTGLSSGTYSIVVEDANGCQSTTKGTVGDVGAPTLTLQSYTNVSCNGGNDGSIVLLGSGGSGTLQYSIDGTTFQTSGTFSTVSAGVYGVLVKDAAGCMDGFTVTISEPPAMTGFGVSVTSHVSCNGGDDGVIEVHPGIGGTGTYSYSVDGGPSQSSTTFSGLTAGVHTVVAEDVASCSVSLNVTVNEPAPLTITATGIDASCNGSKDGEISAVASGGTAPYMYKLDGGSWQFDGEFVGLAAGTYVIYVEDDNGCREMTTHTISEPAAITASITPTMSTCGNGDGAVTVSGSGGSGGPYMYSMDGVNYNSTGSFTGLSAGTYFVIVQDAVGCENTFGVVVNTTTGPSIDSYNTTDVTCNGGTDGTFTINTVSGGTGTLEFSVDGTGWQTGTMPVTFNGLSAGTHTGIVRDGVGCIGSVTFTINEPAPVVANVTVTDAQCNGAANGVITVTASGGTGVMAYSIDGINYQSSNTFNVTAGTYYVYAKDAGGCIGLEIVTVDEPSAIELSAGWMNVTCSGASDGAIIASASGGTGAIQFSIDGVSYQASNVFPGLNGGTYTLYAKDANGCVKSMSVTVNEPNVLNLIGNISDVSCANGSDGVINLTVTGGTEPYQYDWSNGSRNEDIFNLTAGTYIVDVTDGNGCTASESFTVTQPMNPIIINGTITDATGPTNGDGAVDVTVTGGTPPYSYSWSHGPTTEDINSVTPGVYTIEVTDANGCVSTLGFTVNWSTGLADKEQTDLEVKIYPNPARELINLEVDGYKIERVTLLNMVGEVVYVNQPMNERVQIKAYDLAEGMYLARVEVDGQIITRRVSILK